MASRLLTVVLFVLPATALATESSDGSEGSSARAPLAVGASDAYPRQHGVFANLGVFSAVGFGGLTYAYAVSENWAVEAGLGLGLTGVQLSLMPKLAFGRNHRFVVGLGPSVGSMLDGQNTTSLWLNGDLGYEFRDDNGFSVSFVGGFTKGIAGFGHAHRIHSAHILEISDHLPIKIEFIETREKVDAVLTELEMRAGSGLIEIQETTVIVPGQDAH